MKTQVANCIVLKSKNLKGSDKLYTLYSKEFGKLLVLARGIRKINSRRLGNLDTLNTVRVSYRKSEKNEIKYLSEAEVVNSYINLKADLKKVIKAFYIIELVNRYVEEEYVNESLYNLIKNSLTLLDSEKLDLELVVSYFELNFAKLMGFRIDFDKCVVSNRKFESNWKSYKINFGLGGLVDGESGVSGIEIDYDGALLLNYLSNGKIPSVLGSNYTKVLNIFKSYLHNVIDVKIKSSLISVL